MKNTILEALKELKEVHEKKDISLIDPAMEKINNAWKAASEEMYKATQGDAKDSSKSENDSSSDSDNDVTDVEFEEVKD